MPLRSYGSGAAVVQPEGFGFGGQVVEGLQTFRTVFLPEPRYVVPGNPGLPLPGAPAPGTDTDGGASASPSPSDAGGCGCGAHGTGGMNDLVATGFPAVLAALGVALVKRRRAR